MQDYFKTLTQHKTPSQIANDELREAQIEYVRRNDLYAELEQLRAENGNSATLDLVQLVLDTTTRRHR
jgi:hypothetical protein